MKKKYETNFGFGILEALIASGIIAFFAAGIVVLGNMTLRSVVINKHRLQAAYLAQEAVEGLKNIRDSNWLDKNPSTTWEQGLAEGEGLGLRLNAGKWERKSNPDSFDLELDQDGNLNFNSLKQIFTREIKITKVRRNPADPGSPNIKANIGVRVSWQDYGRTRTVEINSILTDWMTY